MVPDWWDCLIQPSRIPLATSGENSMGESIGVNSCNGFAMIGDHELFTALNPTQILGQMRLSLTNPDLHVVTLT